MEIEHLRRVKARQMVQDLLEQAFPHQLVDPRRIGPEEEFPVVDSNGFCGDITPIFKDLKEIGWAAKKDPVTECVVAVTKDGVEISMDVGCGTLEIGFPPTTNLFDHLSVRQNIFRFIDGQLHKRGLWRLNDYAIQPRTPPGPSLWAPKGRGHFFQTRFHSSVHAQTLTASSQVHIDLTREEALKALKILLALSPIFIALDANSPIWCGERDTNGQLAVRQQCWYPFTMNFGYWNNVFCGPPIQEITPRSEQAPATFKELANFISETPFILRVVEKKIENPSGSFATWYTSHETELSPEQSRKAFLDHEGTIWWDARLRATFGTIELRPRCQNKDSWASHALALGLMENLDKALVFVEHQMSYQTWRALQPIAIAQGLKSETLAQLAVAVLILGQEGLQHRSLGEEILLEPLAKRIRDRRSPGHHKLELFEKGGLTALLEHLLNS